MSMIKIIDLNRLSYSKALYIQQKLFNRIRQSITIKSNHGAENFDEHPNFLLLVEHQPVYTIGLRSRQYLDDDFRNKIYQLGADFAVTNRGGLITFHGPGQLVAYPIINLKDFPVIQSSIKRFVYHLESVIINVCEDFNIEASRLKEYPGVWVQAQRKIAALGIHCSRFVTMHGVAINCDVDLQWFNHIIPCGIQDQNKSVTSISRELNLPIKIDDVKPLFIEKFCKQLECTIIK
ncbi:hypothetical protein NH340_JMT03078 [Sarcoptes scabiei]|nr:hypothetical protein NH340_JMT03078 [Sarcoptes scabiei]